MVQEEHVGKTEVLVGKAQSSTLSWPAVLQGTSHVLGNQLCPEPTSLPAQI